MISFCLKNIKFKILITKILLPNFFMKFGWLEIMVKKKKKKKKKKKNTKTK